LLNVALKMTAINSLSVLVEQVLPETAMPLEMPTRALAANKAPANKVLLVNKAPANKVLLVNKAPANKVLLDKVPLVNRAPVNRAATAVSKEDEEDEVAITTDSSSRSVNGLHKWTA
jgi:hypothetical protein